MLHGDRAIAVTVGAMAHLLHDRPTMRSHPILPTVAVALFGLLACNGHGEPRSNQRPSDDPASSDPSAGHSADRPVCLKGGPSVSEGAVEIDTSGTGTGERPDAGVVRELRWAGYDGCERFVLEMAAEETGSGSTGNVRAEVLRDLGVVRIALPNGASVDTAATDARFSGALARSAYTVRAPDGGIYVDLHLAAPAEARVLTLSDPARVAVDLRPGGPRIPPAPAAGQRVVVLQPRPGAASYPLTVTGYARTFEATVVARLEHSGHVVGETFTTATAWADAWGHYSLTIPEGPSGVVRLHVGEHSARDGSWEGVAVELYMAGNAPAPS